VLYRVGKASNRLCTALTATSVRSVNAEIGFHAALLSEGQDRKIILILVSISRPQRATEGGMRLECPFLGDTPPNVSYPRSVRAGVRDSPHEGPLK
jgi:hypothetical protein